MKPFQSGDRVVFKGGKSFAARPGANAIVTRGQYGRMFEDYIDVAWTDALNSGQMDGGYVPHLFRPVDNVLPLKQRGLEERAGFHWNLIRSCCVDSEGPSTLVCRCANCSNSSSKTPLMLSSSGYFRTMQSQRVEASNVANWAPVSAPQQMALTFDM